MIPMGTGDEGAGLRKPRASGDDPGHKDEMLALGVVNPARAGMIPAMTSSME